MDTAVVDEMQIRYYSYIFVGRNSNQLEKG